jgi:CPA1 family monovalent cation:H+ antiporter
VAITIRPAITIYPCCALFAGSRSVNFRHQHILFWGGLRGSALHSQSVCLLS